jgi:hypothetical protein
MGLELVISKKINLKTGQLNYISHFCFYFCFYFYFVFLIAMYATINLCSTSHVLCCDEISHARTIQSPLWFRGRISKVVIKTIFHGNFHLLKMAISRNILPLYTSHAPASSRVNLILFLVNAKKNI